MSIGRAVARRRPRAAPSRARVGSRVRVWAPAEHAWVPAENVWVPRRARVGSRRARVGFLPRTGGFPPRTCGFPPRACGFPAAHGWVSCRARVGSAAHVWVPAAHVWVSCRARVGFLPRAGGFPWRACGVPAAHGWVFRRRASPLASGRWTKRELAWVEAVHALLVVGRRSTTIQPCVVEVERSGKSGWREDQSSSSRLPSSRLPVCARDIVTLRAERADDLGSMCCCLGRVPRPALRHVQVGGMSVRSTPSRGSTRRSSTSGVRVSTSTLSTSVRAQARLVRLGGLVVLARATLCFPRSTGGGVHALELVGSAA
jgi:hypothetical protein